MTLLKNSWGIGKLTLIEHRFEDHREPSVWSGMIASPSRVTSARNALCGDEVSIELLVENESISKIRFHGQGCMVSQACASMLCEGVEGKTIDEVLKATPEVLMDFEIRELTMNRQRCALIAYEALMNALAEYRVDNPDENTRKNDSGSS